MTTTAALASTAIAVTEPVFSTQERLALAGFLAGYTGVTREAYALDLRQFTAWCQLHHLRLFQARRADIECFARDLEALGRAGPPSSAGCAPSRGSTGTPSRKTCSSIRRPPMSAVRGWTMSRMPPGWTVTSSAPLLVAAGLGQPAEHALISLLALNGLRVSEATGASIEALGTERGHRTLTITRKGGKMVTIPLAPRTARAIDLAIGERCDGPLFLAPDGRRLDRHGAARIVRRVAGRAGISKPVGPHTLRHAFITPALAAGVPLRDVQEAASHADPRTTIRYDRARGVSTGTPPISLPPTSPVPPGKNRMPSSGLRLAGLHRLRRRPKQPRAVALRRVTHGEHKQRTLTACADADWYRAELWAARSRAFLRGEAL
jgi:integrase/recombinase XerD